MFEEGRNVAEVADALGVRYQFAYNVHREWERRAATPAQASSQTKTRELRVTDGAAATSVQPSDPPGPLQLHATMADLARSRPIFNSEADFQLALAWEIQRAHPRARLRLEYRPAYLDRRGYLDLWVASDGWAAAIELKYFTRALDLAVDGERFELLNHGAQDISRYDFIRDVERVESVARAQPGVKGYALALTNDSSYWRVPTVTRPTIDAAFRIHEGSILSGRLAWSDAAGAGTIRGRNNPHVLHGVYPLHWADYSRVADGPAGTFRYLLVATG